MPIYAFFVFHMPEAVLHYIEIGQRLCRWNSISVFGGLQDSLVGYGDLPTWDVQTRQNFKVCMFDGDHFFLHSSRHQLL